jgi:hypothetical protein
MSNEGAGGTSGSLIAWSGTARGHAGSPGPSGSVWNGMTQRHGGRDSSSSGRCADDWLVRADSGSTQPSTHQTALTVTASNTAMVHALTTPALYTTQGQPTSADLRDWTKTSILKSVRAFRRHIVVQAMVCLLLTWAAADLLVPQLCSAEQAQSDSPTAPQDHDDCFCCCSHVERARPVEVTFADLTPVVRETSPVQSLPVGAPRTVYHPPLVS